MISKSPREKFPLLLWCAGSTVEPTENFSYGRRALSRCSEEGDFMKQQWRKSGGWAPAVILACCLVAVQPIRAEEAQLPTWATINGRGITETDLSAVNNGQTARTMHNQVYQARKQALDTFIAEQVLVDEAKKRGISREQLIQQEVDAKIPEPSATEIEQLYNANKARLGGKSLEEARPTIVSHLKGQKRQARMQELVRSLRRAADVKFLLKPPPLNVTLEGKPTRGPAAAPVTIVEFSDFQ
jgi:hypothetical protein